MGETAARRGAHLELISWTPPPGRPLDERPPWVREQVAPVVKGLTMPACVHALRRSTEPFLLVGGTADEFWDGALARELTPYVLEIDGAGHGMMVPGPLSRSAEVLGQVTTAVEAFLDTAVWH
ncbi:hypothetical protein [Nonomuraea sp. NPDC049400]|uniref:hypothetical protein n=1 Tax=Nonomuraea sp. NPDC049400 TaxID=3364352 RepID=UPI0037AAD8AE